AARPTPVPYTTLFRSILGAGGLYLAMGRSDPPAAEGAAAEGEASHAEEEGGHAEGEAEAPEGFVALSAAQAQAANLVVVGVGRRSEEHTSELQSRENL